MPGSLCLPPKRGTDGRVSIGVLGLAKWVVVGNVGETKTTTRVLKSNVYLWNIVTTGKYHGNHAIHLGKVGPKKINIDGAKTLNG